MARLSMAGAESNEISTSSRMEANSSGTVAIDTTTVHGGSRSYKCTGDLSYASTSGSISFGAMPYTAYIRAYVNVESYPTGSTIKVLEYATIAFASLRLTTAGVIQLWNNTGSAQIGSDGPTLALGRWYCLEIAMGLATGASDTAEGRVDGVSFASGSGLDLGDPGAGFAGTVSAGWISLGSGGSVIYVDDLAVNDSTGTSQSSWCGPGKQVLLVPISDNARDTLWTGGAGGTTSLFDAVNNLPPVGTATETNLTQIEHAGGATGTTDRYDANLTTYLTAGLLPGDNLLCARATIVHGEDVSTGTKVLNFQGLSNPAIPATGNFNAGNDIGALGTYPTNWTFTRTGFVYDQTVVLGTSPVLRVIRPETATRVASVCFMGLFVEYTPATVTAQDTPELYGRPYGLRGQQQMAQLLAQ